MNRRARSSPRSWIPSGKPVAPDADESIATIVSFWLEENDPKSISQLDLVKYITGKVIEHVDYPFARQPSSQSAPGSATHGPTTALIR